VLEVKQLEGPANRAYCCRVVTLVAERTVASIALHTLVLVDLRSSIDDRDDAHRAYGNAVATANALVLVDQHNLPLDRQLRKSAHRIGAEREG
jgi:hypothetical protein